MGLINIRTEIPGPASRALMARRVAAVPRGVAARHHGNGNGPRDFAANVDYAHLSTG